MITDIGKGIIAKYMLGQAPAYASYIAIGCGGTPLSSGDTPADYSTKTNLDFEMLRVPISSRGFINEDGLDKIVFTAELPTEERYEISEVGIFSAGSNPSAGAKDSKTVFGFTSTENWQYHTASAASAIPTYTAALDAPAYDNIIAIAEPVFQTNIDNPIFYKEPRASRYERARFLNNTILIQGDDSNLTLSAGHLVIQSGSNHLHLTSPNVDFSRNSPIDELRLAFSLVSLDGDSSAEPDSVRILVDFASTDAGSGEYARFEVNLVDGVGGIDFATNRHYVVTKQLQELYTSANFTWDAVTVVKIYACVVDASVPVDDYYVALDAIRLENIGTLNPLYGLTGYSVIQTTDGSTVVKPPNTSNYIEFRFSIDVTGGATS
jgi:hypothetical protein